MSKISVAEKKQRSRHHALGFILNLSAIETLDRIDWEQEYDSVLVYLKKPVNVFRYFEKLTQEGQADALFMTGILYELGIGTTKSDSQAFRYFKLAADQGLAKAQYELASYYLRLAKKQEALKYMQMSADQGYLPALLTLAHRYYKGAAVEECPEKAIEYYTKAFKSCEIDSCYAEHQLFIKRKLLICRKTLPQRQAVLKRKAYCQQAQRYYASLDHEIFYSGSSLLDISKYEQDRNLEILRNIFEQSKQKAVHVLFPHMSYEETMVIRDAMLENPKIVVISTKKNGYGLEEAFYRLGCNPKYLKRCSMDCYGFSNFYGFLFTGISTHNEVESLKNKVFCKVIKNL